MSLLAPVVGALVGGAANKGGQQATTEQKREPWDKAQPYILDNLKKGQELQRFYEQNPFNQQQIEGYSNLFNDTNNFRNNTMPGLMDFANRGMTSTYQRQTGGAPGSGGGYGGAVRPGGLLQSGTGAFAAPIKNTGQVGQPNGLLDLNGAQNPFFTGNKPVAAPVAAPPVDPLAGLSPEMIEFLKRMMAANGVDNSGTGTGADGSASGGVGGLGVGDAGTGGSGD